MDNNSIDMNTMLEALKIADGLERAAARLKGLGSNTAATEQPSLEVLERLGVERYGVAKGRREKPTPILADLIITLAEISYCSAKLDKLFRRVGGLDESGELSGSDSGGA
jgi:hypothetical protein